jgi:hypothetical protein
VLDAPAPADVAPMLARALSDAHKAVAAAAANPYGDAGAPGRIAEVVATAPLERLLAKRFVDVDAGGGA